MVSIQLYNLSHKQVWDEFVGRAKNTHFMFCRDYMDYHADRFQDHSLMFFDGKEKLIAVFPANIYENALYSHQGLTFGGLVVDDSMRTPIMLELFSALLDFSKKLGIVEIIYKRIPYVYHSFPSDEDLYSLFRFRAELYRRDVSSAIYLKAGHPIPYSKGRKYNISVAKKHGLTVHESVDYHSYWKLLNEVLSNEHSAKPVHAVDEIVMLKEKFPNNIKLFIVCDTEKNLLAGTVVYSTDQVAHTQYLANSSKGRELGALDLVLNHLIKDIYKDYLFFDFGISNENNGLYLNEGLIAQKEMFGARAVCHDFYKIKVV